jgi:enoyl-CoA hydratase
MDLVLTGRAVDAAEAHAIGLVNRLVPAGHARQAAEELAAEIAAFPQTCLRHDRLSLLEQEELGEAEAIANELRHGKESVTTEALAGASKFAAGAGRHGGGGRWGF